MYEAAIRALIDHEPERAILLIAREMRDTQQASEFFELEVQDAVNEIKRATDFMKLPFTMENTTQT